VILSVTLPGYAQEETTPMTLDQSSLSELLDALKAGGDLDFMRRAMEVVLQALIDLEAAREIGAGRYERSEARRTYRNGNRDRLLSTKAGDVNLKIPNFWTAFLRSLRARGLSGVQLVISDAHEGLKSAIAAVFVGAAWQRCRVHFMRNVHCRGQQELSPFQPGRPARWRVSACEHHGWVKLLW
jgi:transposase-like protein